MTKNEKFALREAEPFVPVGSDLRIINVIKLINQ